MDDGDGFNRNEYAITILLNKPRFQAGILELRIKWHIPTEGLPDNRALNNWSEQITANGMSADFEQDVRKLMETLKLADRWYSGMTMYLKQNNPYMLRAISPYEMKFEYEGDPLEHKGIKSVWIKVDAETTQEEMLEALKDAKELIELKPQKKQQPKRLDRNLMVLRLHNEDKTTQQIVGELRKLYPDEAYNTDDVEKIIRRIKRTLK